MSSHPYAQPVITDTVPLVPNAPKTPRRGVRVPEELWQAALRKAEERGEVLSEEIRQFLVRYVRRR